MSNVPGAQDAALFDEGAGLQERVPERICFWASMLAMVAMMIVIVAEVALRKFFNHSLEAADQLGGYLLVALTFFSLPVCLARNSFHGVELVQNRMPALARHVLVLVFDAVALLFMVILLWQLIRLVQVSWAMEERSMGALFNELMVPLWIPRLVMPLGTAVLCFTLCRKLLLDWRVLINASRKAS